MGRLSGDLKLLSRGRNREECAGVNFGSHDILARHTTGGAGFVSC
jgi:hypothetical protein